MTKYHEERLTALLILVQKFEKGDEKTKKEIVNFYIKNTKYVNNWDLVDLTAPRIIGAWFSDKKRPILYTFARSNDLWKNRISIIATLYFIIKNKEFEDTLKIAEILLKPVYISKYFINPAEEFFQAFYSNQVTVKTTKSIAMFCFHILVKEMSYLFRLDLPKAVDCRRSARALWRTPHLLRYQAFVHQRRIRPSADIYTASYLMSRICSTLDL